MKPEPFEPDLGDASVGSVDRKSLESKRDAARARLLRIERTESARPELLARLVYFPSPFPGAVFLWIRPLPGSRQTFINDRRAVE